MKRSFDTGLVLGISLVAILLIANGIFAYRSMQRLVEDATWVAHTHHVLDLTAEVLTTVVDAETGQRSFLLTGNDEFLQPYEMALRRVNEGVQRLTAATADNQQQQDRIARLAALISTRLARLQTGIELRRQDERLAQQWVASRQGKQQMDALRELVADIRREEQGLLGEREQQSADTRRVAVGTLLATTLLGLGAVAVCIGLIWRALTSRDRSTEEIRRAHQELQVEMSERSRAEHALRHSERIYRAIGESIDFGVWLCDPDGKNSYASPSFLKLVGLTQQQCADFGWGDVLHPDDAARTISAWKQCVQEAGTWDIEHRFRGVDGRWHPILARGVPVRDDQGNLICWAGINLDISRLKEAEQELLEAHQQLEQRIAERTAELTQVNAMLRDEIEQHSLAEARLRDSVAEKEVLLKEVHHRVKNNMQVISSLLQLQSHQTQDPSTAEFLRESQQRVRSMALVHERLYGAADLGEVDFAEYIAGLTQSLFRVYHVDTDRIHLQVEVGDVRLGIDTAVPCGMLVNELLSNCLKHAFRGRERGHIELELAQVTPCELLLRVRDDGVGLPPAFDPLETRSFGMQIVTALVEQLHGTLTTSSHQGTEFRVLFPQKHAGREG